VFLLLFRPGTVFGFVNGPHGLFSGRFVTVDGARVAPFRNQGGFHMIGSGRHKIETEEQFAASLRHATDLDLDGIVVIGGDDSNTNAAVLAEYFAKHGSKCAVVGCPKTIDGDLKCDAIECSFGFDTACRTFSELIGNIATDGASSRKYHNFVRLMGRSASHITLECALQTCPNVCLIGEELEAREATLASITADLCDLITARWRKGLNHSMILMPEGLVEFVPEIRTLIAELNDILAEAGETPAAGPDERRDSHQDTVAERLTQASREVFRLLPSGIREQLLLERDPHGNVQVSRIETEKLLMLLCSAELSRRAALPAEDPAHYGGEFAALGHFFGYEGRSGVPSLFDATYCNALGQTAARLVESNRLRGWDFFFFFWFCKKKSSHTFFSSALLPLL
jgi:diphosphate--fructose-6-phosphate 1-phosphotransferase